MGQVTKRMVSVMARGLVGAMVALMTMAGVAWAAPNLSLEVDQFSPAGAINNCQSVTFQVTLTNTGADPAVNVNITNTMPAGFTFVSATPALTAQTVPADSLPHTWDITYTATCSSVSGDNDTVVSYEGPLGTMYPDLELNPPLTFIVNPGAIKITKVAIEVGGVPIAETSEPDASIGQTILWRIRVFNSGLGNVSNIEVSDTIEGGLIFSDGTPSPTRVFDSSYSDVLNTATNLSRLADLPPNSVPPPGAPDPDSYVDIYVETTVSACADLKSEAAATWGCNPPDCLLTPVTAQTSVDLQLGYPCSPSRRPTPVLPFPIAPARP